MKATAMKHVLPLVFLSLLIALPGCSAIGMAAGAGAAVGVASQQEGGLSGAATDLRIKARISDLWFRYDVSTFSKLNLTVDEGRVLITGIVQKPDARVEAVRLAWQVEGVKQVINEIRLADSDGFPGFVRDSWIATRLRTALTFDRDVHSINYSIEVVQGTVYLMGVARSQAELDRVIEISRTIPNVRQVVSYVRLPDEAPAAALSSTPSSSAPLSSAPMDPVADETQAYPMAAPAQPVQGYEPTTPTDSGASNSGPAYGSPASLSPPAVDAPVMLPP